MYDFVNTTNKLQLSPNEIVVLKFMTRYGKCLTSPKVLLNVFRKTIAHKLSEQAFRHNLQGLYRKGFLVKTLKGKNRNTAMYKLDESSTLVIARTQQVFKAISELCWVNSFIQQSLDCKELSEIE